MDRYTYRVFSLRRITAPFYVDALHLFGWELVGSDNRFFSCGRLRLSFRRPESFDRHVNIARLQREFEIAAGKIESIEENLNRRASLVSILIGFTGMMLIFLSLILRVIGNSTISLPLLTLGFVFCILSLFCYISFISIAGKRAEPSVKLQFDIMRKVKEEALSLRNGSL